MNHLIIIGKLTADPESRTTQSGKRVVGFTVAVNRKGTDGADFFRVSAWEKLGDVCMQYLGKGRKVMVSGPVRSGSYLNSKGESVGTLDILAQEIEFLSPREDSADRQYRQQERQAIQQKPKQESMVQNSGGFVAVDDEDLPF